MPVYEEYQPHPRWKAAHLSDVVPWRAIIAPGLVLQKQNMPCSGPMPFGDPM